MASDSNIEWTDATWNPVVGCTPVSPGCLNCYAATMARRLEAMGRPEYAPAGAVRIAEVRGGRAVFTGEVRTLEDRLDAPLKWKKPRRVFVNSMSDLFHEAVPFEFIDKVFAVMALTPQHTYQVLTKRPERMAEYFRWDKPSRNRQGAVQTQMDFRWAQSPRQPRNVIEFWPLPNVWLGTSVENQETADERIPHLLSCPAAVRFLSAEPLLGEVGLGLDRELLTDLMDADPKRPDCYRGRYPFPYLEQKHRTLRKHGIDWVIVGGESGSKARPCDVAWIRSIVNQCRGAGVAVFVKQVGARPCDSGDVGSVICQFESYQQWVNKAGSWLGGVSGGGVRYKPRERAVCADTRGRICSIGRDFMRARDEQTYPVTAYSPKALSDSKGGEPSEWPEDLRVREMPGVKP